MNIPIIEVFTSIQGEGVFMGVPSVFVRVSGCNLRCIFKGSICDTPYSSFDPEKSKYGINDVVDEFVKHPNVRHLVLTGGEPTLYDINGFMDELQEKLNARSIPWPKITIETNGTLPIKPDFRVWMYSISPKLSSSCLRGIDNMDPEKIIAVNIGNTEVELKVSTLQKHNRIRINPDVLAQTIRGNYLFNTECQLKFVWSGPSAEKEIKDLLNELSEKILELQNSDHIVGGTSYDLVNPLQYLNTCVYIMPEGITGDDISNNAQEAVEACIRNGWNYTDRLHIRIWGNSRNK